MEGFIEGLIVGFWVDMVYPEWFPDAGWRFPKEKMSDDLMGRTDDEQNRQRMLS